MSGIESIMHRDVVTIERGQTALEAAVIMKDHNLGALVVTSEGGIYGVFSERDLMNRVVAERRDPSKTPVGEVCTLDPYTVEATASIAECYDAILQRGFRHLPIRDGGNRAIGIVSARDFLRCLMVQHETEISIEETCSKLGQLTELMDRMNEMR